MEGQRFTASFVEDYKESILRKTRKLPLRTQRYVEKQPIQQIQSASLAIRLLARKMAWHTGPLRRHKMWIALLKIKAKKTKSILHDGRLSWMSEDGEAE